MYNVPAGSACKDPKCAAIDIYVRYRHAHVHANICCMQIALRLSVTGCIAANVHSCASSCNLESDHPFTQGWCLCCSFWKWSSWIGSSAHMLLLILLCLAVSGFLRICLQIWDSNFEVHMRTSYTTVLPAKRTSQFSCKAILPIQPLVATRNLTSVGWVISWRWSWCKTCPRPRLLYRHVRTCQKHQQICCLTSTETQT